MDAETVIIDGRTFRFVKRSRRGDVAVYTNGELFARVGEKSVIKRMTVLHKKFDSLGFPVPGFVSSGEINAGAYYTEESLGEKCFSQLFRDDMEKYGGISDTLFESFLKVTERFIRAQVSATVDVPEGLSLRGLIRPETLAEELPEYGEKIVRLFDEAVSAVASLPPVLTHGDFNPHNLFPRAVIDFEQTYCAPAGYDAVTNIFSINYFPASRNYEYYRWYSFTPEQERLYYTLLDRLYTEAGLPAISEYRKHFEYFRAVWATKQNFGAPKLRVWRYELFKKNYLI